MDSSSSLNSSLEDSVNILLRLLNSREFPLKGRYDISSIKTCTEKAVNPRFEIVFAGTFSAGKSMLINALLGRRLLHSGTGHVTGRECYVEYAESEEAERVQFTFLSVDEIDKEIKSRCTHIGVRPPTKVNSKQSIATLRKSCEQILEEEGTRTEKGEEAKGIIELIDGYERHISHIADTENKTLRMEELELDAKKAREYAARGSNSFVLKKIRYFCHHPLLEDGNVLVDLPGIDAPVAHDSQITYEKVENPEVSAVICVMSPDNQGETTREEKKLTEIIRNNKGISDRVFYVFNCIDKAWDEPQLETELNDLIYNNFTDQLSGRGINKTSALLGFYARLIMEAGKDSLWGLNTVFAQEGYKKDDPSSTIPTFVTAFLKYCYSDKIPSDKFHIKTGSNKDTKIKKYLEILNEYGESLLKQLILDSGVEEFKDSVTSYLMTDKKPELVRNLFNSIQDLSNDLYGQYLGELENIKNQPDTLEALIDKELIDITETVRQVSGGIYSFLEEECQKVVLRKKSEFSKSYKSLESELERTLDTLIENFSIENSVNNVTKRYNSNKAPLVMVLGEAYFEIAQGIESSFVELCKPLVSAYFQDLIRSIRKDKSYRELDNLLGHDCEIMQDLQTAESNLVDHFITLARSVCVSLAVESVSLYDSEEEIWLYQFRETLIKASKTKDLSHLLEAEKSIRQILEIDFKKKLEEVVGNDFYHIIAKDVKQQIIPIAEAKRQMILDNADLARSNQRKLAESRAAEKINERQIKLDRVMTLVKKYNFAITNINCYLSKMKLNDCHLAVIQYADSASNVNSLSKVQQDDAPSQAKSFKELKELSLSTASENATNHDISHESVETVISNTTNMALQRPKTPSITNLDVENQNPSISDVVSCRVIKLEDFGIFIDFYGKRGLIHKSQISEKFIEDVKEECSQLFIPGKTIYAVYIGDHEDRPSFSTKILENRRGEIFENFDSLMREAIKRDIKKRIVS